MNLKKHALKLLIVILPVFLIGFSFEKFMDYSAQVSDYFEITVDILPLVMSFPIFVVSWYSYEKSRDNNSLFLGAAFMLISIVNLYHLLSYPFMPAFITPNSADKAVFFRAAVIIITPLPLLLSAYIHKETLPAILNKPVLMTTSSLLSLVLLIFGLLYIEDYPALLRTDSSVTAGYIYIVIISSLIIVYTIKLYLKRFYEKPQDHFICIIYGLIILIFSNLSYLYSDHSGNLLSTAGYFFIFIAVYGSSVELPYEKTTQDEKNMRVVAEEKYGNLVDNANDAIITTDLEGRILTWNKAAQNIYGWTAEEVIGKKLSRLLIPLDKQPENEQLIHSIMVGSSESGIESVHKKKDGSSIDVSLTVSPLSNAMHRTIGLSCVIRDISDHKRSEEIVHENMSLAIAIRAKSELLPAMSHDLGTPLNAMIGFSELLKQEIPGTLNDKQKMYVDNILVSSKRMLDIVNDILDLGKAETGKIDLRIEKIFIPEIINETISLFREPASKRRVVFNKAFDPGLDFLYADRNRFKQVLFNIISNAVKYSKPEGGTVTIKTEKRVDVAKISIKDTGIGIRKEDVGKLFSPFEQLDLGIASKYGSTGLGLVVTEKILELHGGKITAESEYGEGSTFTIYLPVVAGKRSETRTDRFGFDQKL